MGVVLPEDGFLEGLRKLCDENEALLIFDEVITGFRLALDGAQGYYGIKPDLTTFGKIIGGGMPVGAYGGRKDIMEKIAPLGPVYQAGTLSGNPVAMAAGIAQLTVLKETPNFYKDLNEKSDCFFTEMDSILNNAHIPHCLNHIGSLGCVFFTREKVKDYDSAQTSRTRKFRIFFRQMLDKHIYIAPSQFEAMFISSAHTQEDLELTLEAVREFDL
jgi:glutamate-1-semialdehyde 2,1-aminomutase